MTDGRAASKRRWMWTGLVALAAALLAAAVWYWRMPDAGERAPVRARTALSLKVDRAGSDYRVTWDGASPAVLGANAGRLSIEDGSFRKELELGREELRNGTLLYAPVTDDVTFSLRVFGANGDVVESRRLLLDKLPEPAP